MGFHVVKGKSGTHLIPHHTRGDDRLPLGTAAMAAVAAAAFLLGSGTGVILSPDQASPSPDWRGYVDDAVAEQMAEHLEFDHEPDHTHAPEVTPSVEPSPTPTPSPAASGRRSTTPGATTRPTAAPTSRPTPTARPAPSVAPSPTCFRPGKPRSSPDPCAWPPDG